MKESSEKAIEVNFGLRLNVDELKNDITFKVKSGIDDSYEVYKITATRNPMNKWAGVCDM